MLHRGQHFVAEVYSRLNLNVKKKIRCVIGADCLGGLLSPQGPQQKDAPSLCLPGAYSFLRELVVLLWTLPNVVNLASAVALPVCGGSR